LPFTSGCFINVSSLCFSHQGALLTNSASFTTLYYVNHTIIWVMPSFRKPLMIQSSSAIVTSALTKH